MKFSDCNFIGKHDVRNNLTRAIFTACRESIPKFYMLNTFIVEDYIHLLIDESEYNPKENYFYMDSVNVKISSKVFKNVAIEYILEHRNDFTLSKYKK